MGVWAWLRPGDRIWKVVSDHESGTITVYDEKGDLILEKKGLTKEAIILVEKNFLDIAAKNLDADASEDCKNISGGSKLSEDPMFA